MGMLDQDQQEKIKQYLLQNPPQTAVAPAQAPVLSASVSQPAAPANGVGSSSVDWGRLLSTGLSGLGDAYSAAAGRQGTALQNLNQMYDTAEKNKLEQEKLRLSQKKVEPIKTYQLSSTLEKSLNLPEGTLKDISDENLTKIFPQLAEMKRFSTPKEETVPLINAEGKQVGTTKKGAVILKEPKETTAKPITKAQNAVDRVFANDYVDFNLKGGYTKTKSYLKVLQEAIDELEKDSSLTGGLAGLTPKAIKDYTNPKSSAIQESVEGTVQESLKSILGAQYTEREGRGVLERSYNPRLKTSENVKKLKRLKQQLEEAAEQKYLAGEYFNENGTMQGFKGKLYSSANDFDSSINQKNSISKAQKALEWAKANPQDPRSKAIANKALAEGAK